MEKNHDGQTDLERIREGCTRSPAHVLRAHDLACGDVETDNERKDKMSGGLVLSYTLLTAGYVLGFVVYRKLEQRGISLTDRRTRKTAAEILLSVVGCWVFVMTCVALLAEKLSG
jgi:hypothetical protein